MELLSDGLGLVCGTMEDAMPVAVQGQRDTVVVDNLPEHQQVPVGVLLLSEQGEGDCPGGVVHSADEGQVGSSGGARQRTPLGRMVR